MTRGNQREVDRQKAQNKLDAKKKADGKGGDPLKRNESDAAALAAKVAAKQAQKEATAANGNASGNEPILPKKVKKDTGNVADLLLAGLPSPKKKTLGSK